MVNGLSHRNTRLAYDIVIVMNKNLNDLFKYFKLVCYST